MKKLFINNLKVGHLVKKYKNFVSNLNIVKPLIWRLRDWRFTHLAKINFGLAILIWWSSSQVWRF